MAASVADAAAEDELGAFSVRKLMDVIALLYSEVDIDPDLVRDLTVARRFL